MFQPTPESFVFVTWDFDLLAPFRSVVREFVTSVFALELSLLCNSSTILRYGNSVKAKLGSIGLEETLMLQSRKVNSLHTGAGQSVQNVLYRVLVSLQRHSVLLNINRRLSVQHQAGPSQCPPADMVERVLPQCPGPVWAAYN